MSTAVGWPRWAVVGRDLMLVMTELAPLSLVHDSLQPNGRKARYGVSFLETICSEAGVPLTEPRPDTDVRAVDCMIGFPEGEVYVQVKCSAKKAAPSATTMSWQLKQGWVDKWARIKNPVYFLIVRVQPTGGTWIDHPRSKTLHRAHAIWTRVDVGSLGPSIRVPLSNRFLASTLAIWHSDVLAGYGATPQGGR